MARSRNGVKLAVAAALLLATLVIILITRSGGGESALGSVYYYDLTTGALYAAAAKPSDDQTRGVRAYVYGCGDCTAQSRRIGYLTSISAEAQVMMRRPLEQVDSAVIERGRLIAPPPSTPGGEIHWVAQNTPAGLEIRRSATADCREETPVECRP